MLFSKSIYNVFDVQEVNTRQVIFSYFEGFFEIQLKLFR